MIRRLLTGLHTGIKETPAFLWAFALIFAVLVGQAGAQVTHTLYANLTGNVTGNVTGNLTGNVNGNVTGNTTGSIVVPSIGTATFNELTPSQCVQTDVSDNIVSSGGACGGSTSVTAPITNSGTSQNPNIGLSTPLATTYGGTGTASPGETFNSPLSATGSFGNYSISCTTCLTTAGGQTVTSADTFTGGFVSNGASSVASGTDATVPWTIYGHSATQSADLFDLYSYNGGGQIMKVSNAGITTFNDDILAGGNFTSGFGGGVVNANFEGDPTAACQTNAPIATVCIGSPTATAGLAIGKVTGGWGGTTSANSGQIQLCSNIGSADRCGFIYESSGGALVLGSNGSGNVQIATSGGLSVGGQGGLLGETFIAQNAANNYGGKCTMSASTSCTIALGHTYTTPICYVSPVVSAAPTVSGGYGISGATLTVWASASNSLTWSGICFGDPT